MSTTSRQFVKFVIVFLVAISNVRNCMQTEEYSDTRIPARRFDPIKLGRFQKMFLLSQARFPSKRNRLHCVRCVLMETGLTASACVGKQPIMVATASTEHPIGRKMPDLCIFLRSVAQFTLQ